MVTAVLTAGGSASTGTAGILGAYRTGLTVATGIAAAGFVVAIALGALRSRYNKVGEVVADPVVIEDGESIEAEAARLAADAEANVA